MNFDRCDSLRIDYESQLWEVVFNIFKAINTQNQRLTVFAVNVIHAAVAEIQEKHHSSDPLRQALVFDASKDDKELADMIALLDAQTQVCDQARALPYEEFRNQSEHTFSNSISTTGIEVVT